MTHEKLIPSNLPVYFQCLRVPCEVGLGTPPSALSTYANLIALQQLGESGSRTLPETRDPSRLYWDPKLLHPADTYDPWEERGRFFRVKEGDDESLIEFLRSVGLFRSPALGLDSETSVTHLVRDRDGQHHTVRYVSEAKIESIWATRRIMENSLRGLNKHTGRLIDFTARIILVKGEPRVTITTCTFLESLLLTLAVDRVQKAKVRKCARPDCGILFSTANAYGQKYCEWYCGHIESVRKSRKLAKKAKRVRKER